MAWINKPERKPKAPRINNPDDENRALRAKAYNSKIWRKVRIVYLQQHPICEKCLEKGIVNAGSVEQPLSIHHKKSPFQDGKINWELLGDMDNLMTLCPQCHQEEHNLKKYGDSASPEKIIEILDELLNGNLEED